MRTVYPKMQGGLGNQLFEYAMARALSLRTGADLLLNVDAFEDDVTYARRYSLDMFQVRPRIDRVRGGWLRRVLEWKKELLPRLMYAYCREPWYAGREALPEKWRGRLWLNGYWQSEAYFADFADVIHKDLTFAHAEEVANSEIGKQIASCEESVFVHVRSFFDARGKGNAEASVPIVYYENAVRYLVEHVGGEPCFFLFSDEPEFAESRMRPIVERLGARMSVVRAGTIEMPGTDFHLMRMCRHAIVGNSSFSWWAAWLGERDSLAKGRPSVIVRPDGIPFWGANREFWPDRWVEIETNEAWRSQYREN